MYVLIVSYGICWLLAVRYYAAVKVSRLQSQRESRMKRMLGSFESELGLFWGCGSETAMSGREIELPSYGVLEIETGYLNINIEHVQSRAICNGDGGGSQSAAASTSCIKFEFSDAEGSVNEVCEGEAK